MRFDHENLVKLAKEKEDENRDFRKFLKFYDDLSDDELDQLVFKIVDEASSMVECTSCGRCCKELRPRLSKKDQRRRAIRLGLSVEQLKEKYLRYEDSDDEQGWRIKGTPCPFHRENKCTVYEDRPQNCRDYPYLHKPNFSYRTMGMVERTFTCPIVFNVMEELKEKLEFRTEDFGEDWQ
jgi:Fe-S-cluster containining protein